jgi:uncharacterized protein
MMLLRNKDKQTLLNIFSAIDTPIEVWAYGSRVNGTAHEGSDLDLVIRTQHPEKLPLHILKQLKEKIQHSNIPIIVELFDWQRLPSSFHQNITANHEVLFSNINAAENNANIKDDNDISNKNNNE